MKNKLLLLTFILSVLFSPIVSAQMQWGDAEPDWIAEAKRKAVENQNKEQAWTKNAYARYLGLEVEDEVEDEDEVEEEEVTVTPAVKANKEIVEIDDEQIEVLLVEE